MNKFLFRNRFYSLCILFSVAIVFAPVTFVSAQSDAMAEAQAKQAKMMESQMLMQQLMQLNYNAELRKELEVVDDQVEEVKELGQDYQRDMMKFHQKNAQLAVEMQKLSMAGKHKEAQELGEKYQQLNQELSDKYMEKAEEVLLPHQIQRLKQIAKRQGARFMNEFQDEFGVVASVADEIGLSADEKKRLIDTIRQARKEYYESVADAKKKANEKIMASLTTEQKEKMKEILGEEYDQEAMQRKAREEMMKKQREMMEKRKQQSQKQ